jgi:hypothetical protein
MKNSEMMLSKTAEEELRALSRSQTLKNDMEAVMDSRHNPFLKAGAADADTYIAFATSFNEFINHEPKPFAPIVDRDMRL